MKFLRIPFLQNISERLLLIQPWYCWSVETKKMWINDITEADSEHAKNLRWSILRKYDWKTLISFTKRSVLDVWQGSKDASIKSNIIVMNWLIIYLSLLRRLPKYPSHIEYRIIQYGIYYSPTSIHVHKVQMLAETAWRNISIVLQQT